MTLPLASQGEADAADVVGQETAVGVEWHLRQVFTKLGVGSRPELRWALASLGQAGPQPQA